MIYYRCTYAWTDKKPVLEPGRIYKFKDEDTLEELKHTLLHEGYQFEQATKKEYRKQQLADALE